jgi:cytochrome d ubiquinol oxidase subunit I
VMLFGHGRVSERVQAWANFLVAFGTTMSAFWILSLNSWMQTPAGVEIVNGEFVATDWLAIVFNPSLPYRLTHVLLASGLTVSFLLAGVSAWQVLRGQANASTPKVMRLGLSVAAILIPLQILAGDAHGLNTFKHQPQKIAAMEGVWQTERGAPLLAFAWPDETTRSNHWAIGVPHLASLILTHDAHGEIRGLDEFKGQHPAVRPLFFGFRIMVGLGVLMLVTSWLGWWQMRRRGWQSSALPRWLLWGLVGMTFSGWMATVAGWYVTEMGRQPYVVYGLLRTADVASTTPAPMIAATLVGYVSLYLALLLAYIGVLRYMAAKPLDTSTGAATRHPHAATVAQGV